MTNLVTAPGIFPLVMEQAAPVITALALLVTALCSGLASIISMRNGRKADYIARSVNENAGAINSGIAEMNRTNNGIKDELLASARREARAAGILEGRAQMLEQMMATGNPATPDNTTPATTTLPALPAIDTGP